MKIKSFIAVAVLAIAVLCFGLPAKTFAADCMQQYTSLSSSAKISCLTEYISELMAQIQMIRNQQQEPQAQPQAQPQTQPETWCHTFGSNLGYAQSGSSEVGHLHTALDKEGFSYFPDTGNTYANATMSAVARFQLKYGISPARGYVGASTRVKLNLLYGCSVAQPLAQPSTQPLVCTPKWTYTSWSACTNGTQTRTVTDLNSCGTTTEKPATIQSCTEAPDEESVSLIPYDDNDYVITPSIPDTIMPDSCEANWNCTAWSACSYGTQTKTCTDLNGCEDVRTETQQCGSVNEPSITIISPTGTEQWQLGTPHTIRWTATEISNVNIALVRSNNSRIMLASNVSASSGTYSWTIPTTITTGTYAITIYDTSNTSVFKTSSQFGIVASSVCTPKWTYTSWSACTNGTQTRTVTDLNDCGVNTDKPATFQSCTEKSITITSPASGDQWKKLSRYNIRWTSVGVSKVNILMQGTTQVGVVSNVYALNGLYSFTVPSNIPDGNYKIVIYDSTNSSVVTTSPQFSIGSSGSCTPSWFCQPWGICSNGVKTRTCSDVNYCEGSVDRTETLSCTTASTCADSDGDMPKESSYFVAGTTQTESGTYQDSCADDAKLNEYYCYSNKKYTENVLCEYGCWLGKCNQQSEARSIRLNYPNGGETLQMGQIYQITYSSNRLWVRSGYPVSVYLEKGFKNGATDYIRVGSGIDPAKFSFNTANFPSFVGNDLSIKICSWDGKICDRSDDYFTITSSVAQQSILNSMVASLANIAEQIKSLLVSQ